MNRKLVIIVTLVFCFFNSHSQDNHNNFSVGLNYGFGGEFKNTDYYFSNNYYKIQLYYVLNENKHFHYEILVQPEVNFAQHQLLNYYFVRPEEPDYIKKREEYTKLKQVHEYVLNIGFLLRKPVGRSCSFYFLGSVGPMIIDTETERISEGFAFSDVLGLGFSVKIKQINFDIRPSFRHVSNAGITSKNSGYNTKNIEFGISYTL